MPSLPLKYACQPLSKMLHRLAKNGHASRARASGVFHFLPSPFTFTPYILIYNKLQVKAKTVFAFTPCDLPFLTRCGREIPHENAEKAVDFDQKRAYLCAKTHNNPSDSRAAVKAKVNTELHLFLHRINLIYCVLHKQVKGEGKKRKMRCAHALPRARKCTFRQHPTVFRETHRRRGITSPPKLTICPASHTTMKRGKALSAATGIGVRVRAGK